jgi:hypothetical protein
MVVASDEDIRGRVLDLLTGDRSFDEFEAWFVGETWDERTALVAQIDHLLAERSLLSRDEILNELRSLVSTVTIREHESGISTGGSANTLNLGPQRLGGSQTITRHLEFVGR